MDLVNPWLKSLVGQGFEYHDSRSRSCSFFASLANELCAVISLHHAPDNMG